MCCNAEQESKKAKRTVKSNEVKMLIICLFKIMPFSQCSPWMLQCLGTHMTKHYKRILEQGGLLDDLVIYAALMLLRDQFPTMSGFQPTVPCQVKGFKPMNTDGML